MKIYLVGGAVRDELMGLTPSDLDYVVVGSTPDEMLNIGYNQVGSEFPVFIHPETGDEYALARTEVKDGEGYLGFNCQFGTDVTIEDDLLRRDLTINAIAKDLDTGDIIDPYGGVADIENKVLRATSDAFSEDPVRVLRVARFAARFTDFEVSDDLTELMSGVDLSSLTAERVWLELNKALSCPRPSRFFKTLLGLGVFPEIEDLVGVQENNRWHPEYDVFEHIMLGLDYAASQGFSPEVIFGVLCHDLGKPEAYAATEGLKSTKHEMLGVPIVEALCARLKAPKEYSSLAVKSAKFHTHVHLAFDMKPKTIHKLFKNFKNRRQFARLLLVALSDKRGRGKPACDWVYPQPNYLTECYSAMLDVVSCDISGPMLEAGKSGVAIGEAIRRAEISAIAGVDRDKYKKPYEEFHALL